MQRLQYPIFASLFFAAGCAWLGVADADRQLARAQADDRACRAEGYRWPGDAYVECRRQLADARQRELWEEMQLASAEPGEFGLPAGSGGNRYRPIRFEDFRCQLATSAAGEAYVDCRETD